MSAFRVANYTEEDHQIIFRWTHHDHTLFSMIAGDRADTKRMDDMDWAKRNSLVTHAGISLAQIELAEETAKNEDPEFALQDAAARTQKSQRTLATMMDHDQIDSDIMYYRVLDHSFGAKPAEGDARDTATMPRWSFTHTQLFEDSPILRDDIWSDLDTAINNFERAMNVKQVVTAYLENVNG